MSFSFSFNNVDMAAYGLVIKRRRHPFVQETSPIQLLNRAYGLGSLRPKGTITLDVAITASTVDDLRDNFDSIKYFLNRRIDTKLTVDWYDDRYWMARFNSIDVNLTSPTSLEGIIVFDAFDPPAYDNTETDHDHIIDEDPEDLIETAEGTERTLPVITLTCDALLTDKIVDIENFTSGETFEWEGDLDIDDILVVNSQTGHVTKNDIASMATVNGQFVSLLPGNNDIQVRGFSGQLNFTYRARYV